MGTPTKVLVVDDNVDCLQLVSRMLRGDAYRVVCVDNGPEALERMESDPPDIVLLDVMMPGMTGFEVLESLRNNSRIADLSVIMLTASTNDDDVMSAYQYGSDYYITKPFTAEQLRYGIDLVLGRETAAAAEPA